MIRIIFLLSFFIGFQITYGQSISSNYKLEVFVNSQSVIFWKKTFERVTVPMSYPERKYEIEEYSMQYKSNTRSKSIGAGIGFNWLETDKFRLSQQIQFGIGTFSGTVHQQLINIGEGDTTMASLDYSAFEIPAGYESSASFFGTERTGIMEVLGIRKWKGGWGLGGGLSLVFLNRDTRFPTSTVGYTPYREERGNGTDRQFNLYGGLTFFAEKKWNQFAIYVTFSQSVFSKKMGNGTAKTIGPTALNLNFRMPAVVQIGMSFSFLEAKNR